MNNEKYALITGASGGIGKEIAKVLARDGYNLYLHYHKNVQGIKDIYNEIRNEANHVTVVQADLAAREGVKELISAIQHPIDSIILNSGKSYFGLVTDMTETEVNEMVQLHVTSPFLLTQQLLPRMISNKRGNVIAISSIWGATGASCEVLYSMVKGGINSFVKALAKEVAPSGIRVNGIAPGAIDTQMLNIFSEQEKNMIAEEIPMGRLGKPQEVAELVSFLLSEKSSYINGQIININGAWHC